MLERDIQANILRALRAMPGVWAVKYPATFQRGVPDLLVCYRGRFVALEVKRPGQTATPIQRAVMKQIQAAGGVTAVVHSLDEVKAILARVAEEQQSRRADHAD